MTTAKSLDPEKVPAIKPSYKRLCECEEVFNMGEDCGAVSDDFEMNPLENDTPCFPNRFGIFNPGK